MSTDVQARAAQLPQVPLTIEGSSVLHQMFRFRWPEWRKLDRVEHGEEIIISRAGTPWPR